MMWPLQNVAGDTKMLMRATIALYALGTAAVVILHALVTVATARDRSA